MDFVVLESMPDATVIIDNDDGSVVYLNRAAEELFGHLRGELVGQPVELLMPARFREMHRFHRAGYSAAPRRRPMGLGLELEGLRKDGESFPAEISLAPMGVSPRSYTVAAIRDVTERKKIEQRAQRWQKAQEEVRQRDEFLSLASRSLQGPLAALQRELGALQHAADLSAGSLQEVLGKMGAVGRQTRHLWRLVSELLDLSQLRLGRLQLEPEDTDLAQLTQETVGSLREEVEQTGSELTLQAEEPAVGHWDRLRIRQVVANLLLNAMKFGEGKPISTKVDADPERARVMVADQGVGIASEDQAQIFQPFKRAVAAGTVTGLGLGLYIARQIVQAHGGALLLRSEPNAGSTFTVELPRTPPSPAPPRRPVNGER